MSVQCTASGTHTEYQPNVTFWPKMKQNHTIYKKQTYQSTPRVNYEYIQIHILASFIHLNELWRNWGRAVQGQFHCYEIQGLTMRFNGKIHKTQVPTVWIPWDFHKTHLFPWKVCLFWHLNPQRKLAGVHLHSELQWHDRDTPPFLQ